MKVKRAGKLALAAVVALSLALAPAMDPIGAFASEDEPTSTAAAEEETTSQGESQADTNLDGKNVLTLMLDDEKKQVLQDPMFYRYYDISTFGTIKEKTYEDEMDKYNSPSADTKDMEAEVVSDMNCIGCGVTGMGKAQVPSKYSNYTKYNCLDISEWQGKISAASWTKLKNAGVTHVIIRVGGSYLKTGKSFSDTYYGSNINGAYNAGMKIGVYYFSQALTTTEAANEAAYTVKLIEAYKSKIKLPVVFDYESNESGRLTGKKLKALGNAGTAYKICKAFCDKVKSSGYTPMVYANYTTLVNYLKYKTLQNEYKIWLANYTTNGTATTYPGEYYMWQYSSSGRVNGLSGYVDMNYIFVTKSQASKDTESSTTETTTQTSTQATTTSTTATQATSPSYTVKDVTPYKVKVKTTLVNYRTGPGLSCTLVGKYYKGKVLTVTGKCTVDGDRWGRLKNGYFVSLKYTKKYGYQVKTKQKMNYRSGPGLKYKVKGQFKKGKVLTIVSTTGKWGKTINGNYVSLRLVTKL